MDASFLDVSEIKGAMETLKYISADPEIRALYDLRQKTINDHNSEVTVAREEGKAEGREEGIAEGEFKGKRETARAMLSEGIATSIVSKCTGLTIDEIKAIN
jgi:predicted transposase/invertase (TIGR01784 family)